MCGGISCKVVTSSATYVYKQDVADGGIKAGDHIVGDGVEAGGVPVCFTGAVGAHEQVEMLEVRRRCDEPFEEGEQGLVCILEGAVDAACGGAFVFGAFEELRETVERRS